MRRIDPRKIVIAVAATVLAAIVVRAVRSSSGPAPDAADVEAARREVPPPPFPPDVRAPIAPEGVVVAPGLVEPEGREVRVGAPAAAVVRDVYVSEGDRVAAGAPLACGSRCVPESTGTPRRGPW